MRFLLFGIIGLVILGIVGVAFTIWRARTVPPPSNVGGGDLQPCPDTSNCVSTLQTDDEQHRMEPISYTGTLPEARQQLISVINELPRSEVITQTDDYIHVVFRSATMGFPDDVEFTFDEDTQQIDFRSAARMGRDDLGVNRDRMQTIRDRFGTS